MRIATRLYLGFGLILLLMLGLTIYGVFQVLQVDRTLTKVNNQDSVEQRQAINFRGSVHDRAIAIRDVMERGNTQATNSVAQAQRAGDALRAIHQSMTRLNDMNAQIATAAEEQSAVANEINHNFSRITQTAASSSMGAREISEASTSLEALAHSLQSSVGKFRVNES